MFQDGSFGTISSTSEALVWNPDRAPYIATQSACCLRSKFGRQPVTQRTLHPSVQPKASRGAINTRSKPRATFPTDFTSSQTDVDLPACKCTELEAPLITCRQYWFQAFPFWQFHVLFNSLFKVLFIFPSRYLFAIGLSPIFSFRWYLPPILVCIPKQTDSLKTYHTGEDNGPKTGFSPSMMPHSKGLMPMPLPKTFL